MKVLVTGGCGFIGSHFIRVIFEHRPDWEVVNLDALTYAGNLANTLDIQTHPRYRFVYGSITNQDLVSKLVSEVDAVVNFAAETHVDRSIQDNEPFILTNVLGVQRLIDACIKHGKRFHHVSTDEVFGSLGPEDPKFDENTAYAPQNPYSATKAASDHLVRAAIHTHGLQGTISNCTNNYGPYLYPEKFLSISITNLFDGKPVPIHGDGRQVRDWIHVKDHGIGILSVLEKGQSGHTYMMGGDAELTIDETAKALLKVLGLKENMLLYINDRPGQDRRYAIDYSKITTELGWTPTFTFEEGLTDMVNWYRKNESWWRPIKQSSGYRRWINLQLGIISNMNKIETPIKDLVIIEPQVFGDDRGFFMETYNADKFAEMGISTVFNQDNHSRSAKGVLRGLHFQLPPKPMAKLVRCTRGRLWDVAVDIRKDSPTYLKWYAVELSEENKKMFYVPEGFAHGFYALEDCDLVYKCSNTYDQELDANVAWNDPDLAVDWPVEGEPALSGRDQEAPKFADLDLPF